MKKTFITTLFALFLLPVMAQKKLFTLDDLIPGGSTYYAHSYPATKHLAWWGDACIELGMENCQYVDKDLGTTDTGFVLNTLTLEHINHILAANGRKTIDHFYNASFPYPDKPYVLIDRGREKTLIDWINQKVIWKLHLVPEASNTDWNTHSLSTAYTIDHNLYVATSDGTVHPVSTDGSLDLVYGESVHRDEFGIEKGTFWNPDGTLLAFYKMDQSMVSKYPQVNITLPFNTPDGESRCAQTAPDPYPMAGETSHKVYVGIFDPQTNKTIYLNTGDPTDRYFTNIAWSPDGTRLYLIELNRDQNHGSLDEYDALTGEKLRTLFTEDNPKYFEPRTPIQFLPWNKNQFIYQTRRDGYNHIYLYNKDGKCLKQLTVGAFEVMDVLGFNEEQQTILYTSNEKDPLQKNVFSVNMKGQRTLLGNSTGWHNATLSESGRFFIDNYSSPLIARHIDIVPTDNPKTQKLKNSKTLNYFSATDPWAAYQVPTIKVGTLKAADGVTDLYYRLILPTDFDPAKKYPAVVYVYGGPHAHNIDATRNWGARGWDIWMAQQGYVMFCLDNRGSEHRGLDFEQATFRHLGVEEMKDQLRGVEYLKSLPYVDANRLGVHGWSFGGFMTTSLMTTYPDVFKVGVAGGPVIDWRFYEVMYGERYMDTPQSNPEGYEENSLLRKAKNLQGRLLVIYGGNDPVCVPQHTLSFMRACIDAGTYPDLFTYPGDGHNMMGTDRVHLHHVITRYFEDHLK
ncbi:MAG: DPP IV N-terminal domain-containing protein [Bacteroidaceae bacterium]|nr:DPP IV N-terminal domain-containing protein [Bacteroidaceae bacterium]